MSEVIKKITTILAFFHKKWVILSILTTFLLLNSLKLTFINFYITDAGMDYFAGKWLLYTGTSGLILILLLFLRYRAFFIIFYLFQIIYFFAHISYQAYFHVPFSFIQSLRLWKESIPVITNFAIPFVPFMLVLLIDLPFFIIITIFWKTTFRILKEKFFILRIRYWFSIVLFLFFIIQQIVNYIDEPLPRFLKERKFFGDAILITLYGTLTASFVNYIMESDEDELVKDLSFGSLLSINSNKSRINSVKKTPNFFVIQMESVDAAIVQKEYNGEPITPFLHSLRTNSIYYPYCMSYHKGGNSSDAEFSIFNSVESFDNYPGIQLRNYNYSNSMIKELRKNGYKAYAYHGNSGQYFNRSIAYTKMGFNDFFDKNYMNIEKKGWGVPDGALFDFILDDIKRLKEPFYIEIITITSHKSFTSVYYITNINFFPKVSDNFTRHYFNSIRYVDNKLKLFITGIRKKYPNSYILMYGDHSTLVRSKYFTPSTMTYDSRYFEFVPLFIITPDKKHYIEKKFAISFLDIAPTILLASGINFRIHTKGKNLLNKIEDDYIPFRGGLYKRSILYKLINDVVN